LTEADAESIAMRLLARREHSFEELVKKLAMRGVAETVAMATVRDLRDKGLQSDRRYAGAIVRTRTEAGYGCLRIRAELRQRGVVDSIVESVLEEHSIDWVALARRRIRRRYSADGLDSLREKSRVTRHLLARGFHSEHVREALETAWAEDDSR